MRTTLDIQDEAYAIAKAIAQERNEGLGRTISEIILKFAHPPVPPPANAMQMKNGLPVVRIGRVVTSDDVRRVLDESE